MSDHYRGKETIEAARRSVIRAAARRMLDTDEHFYLAVSKWLERHADRAERTGTADLDAYRIAEAYLESEPRLRRWA